jgi:WD40 repeat protein/serine/threonine protein kinase
VLAVPADAFPTLPPRSRQEAAAPDQTGPIANSVSSNDPTLAGLLAPPQSPGELGRLGPYRVLKVLGRGGMGVVFQAEDPHLKRLVAIKAMLPAVAVNPSSAERFLREARAAARLNHDHIAAIHHIGEERGVIFLVMPLLDGEPLEDRLRREGKLSPVDVLRIGRETAVGLAAAHAKGLIHRDIKPANIWLEAPQRQPSSAHGKGASGQAGRVKILDFGLARQASADAQLTQTGAIVGTPAYMAPEQGQGQSVDARSDLFSLGCVLYRMCTGEPPFDGPDTMGVLIAVVTQEPAPPSQLNPRVPVGLNDLILTLLAKDPTRRPASAEAVADALAALENDGHAFSGQVSGGSHNRRGIIAGAGVLCAALLTGLFLIHRGPDETTPPPSQPPPGGRPAKPVVRAKPQSPVAVAPSGHPISALALVRAPAAIPGVRSWTIETRLGRAQPRAVAYSPRGGRLAISSADGTVRVYDTATGKLFRALVGHPAEVRCLAWSPDGVTLATGCDDKHVRLLRAEEGRRVRTFSGHTGAIRALAWSPGGERLASGGDDKVISVWDVKSGQPLPPLVGHDRPVVGLAWSPDGKRVASNQQGLTLVWEVDVGQVRRRFSAGHRQNKSVSWSKDGTRLACVGGQGIQVWEIRTGKVLREWKAHGYGTDTVAWSPDGSRLASLGHDGWARVWAGGKEVAKWPAPVVNFPVALDWAPDSQALAYSGWEGVEVRAAGGRLLHHLTDNGWGTFWVVVKPGGRALAAEHYDRHSGGAVRLWGINAARLERTLPVFRSHLSALAWSPDAKRLAVPGFAKYGRILDLPSGGRHDLRDVLNPRRLTWSPDGKILTVFGRTAKRVLLFDAQSLQPLRLLEGGGLLQGLAWSPDSRWAATGSDDQVKAVRLFEVASGKYRPLAGHQARVSTVAFAPDSKRLASGGRDRVVRLWEVESGRLLEALPGHTQEVTRLAWSPGGRVLASAGQDRTIRLWDIDAGKALFPPARHPAGAAQIERLAWSPDERILAVAGGGRIALWDAATGKLVRVLGGAGRTSLAWSHDGKTLVAGTGKAAVQLWDVAAGRLRCTLLNLRNEQGLAVTPDGHYAGTPGIEGELVYVVDAGRGQETLTPEEFARRFGWKNDPGWVRLRDR